MKLRSTDVTEQGALALCLMQPHIELVEDAERPQNQPQEAASFFGRMIFTGLAYQL